MWVKIDKPATLTKYDKETLINKVNQYIELNEKLYKKANWSSKYKGG